MKKLVKIMAMTMVLAAILTVALAGTVFAANGNQGEECPYGDCLNGDCEPNEYAHNYDNNYASPGPHGMQHQLQKGKLAE